LDYSARGVSAASRERGIAVMIIYSVRAERADAGFLLTHNRRRHGSTCPL
jgi:hypothetical protein